jgi:hypothetical protein
LSFHLTARFPVHKIPEQRIENHIKELQKKAIVGAAHVLREGNRENAEYL